MALVKFDNRELVNLRYALARELIRVNHRGAYASSTIINFNSRKYHGLLVAPQPQLDEHNHLFLASLDETVIQRDAAFNLAIHKYPGGIYQPRGHKYITDFATEKIPAWTYRVGGVILRKEIVLHSHSHTVFLKYKLLDAHSPTRLQFRPFLAFRNVHNLSKANTYVNHRYTEVPNGICMCLYAGYDTLYIQFSKKVDYVHVPDWYYNIEYPEEQLRGYPYQEDLFVPGYFELPIRKGEEVVVAAGLTRHQPRQLKKLFEEEIRSRLPRDTFEHCLKASARQFIIRSNGDTNIVAGWHWFGSWGRDTFIALPGLTLELNDIKTFHAVMETMIVRMRDGLFPNTGNAYNSADAPLWFIHALQQLAIKTGSPEKVWKRYKNPIKRVLDAYRYGTRFFIRMDEDGLITAGQPGMALTWMDAVVDGIAVTSRAGKPVEINALWYNALCFCIEAARAAGDEMFISDWEFLIPKVRQSFIEKFYDKQKGYLADVINVDGSADFSVRPNQIIAAGLPYSPLDDDMKAAVVKTVKSELLTPRGLRTLSPKNPNYKGIYKGDQRQRDLAYHQGTAWPWLLEFFASAWLQVYESDGVALLNELYEGFKPELARHGLYTISEIYDGDPPHKARGAISQAWSVAALIRMKAMIARYQKSSKV